MVRVRPHGRWLVAGALALVVTATLTTTAAARPAASNGSIVFRRYLDNDHSTGAVFTIVPDGSGERQITRPPSGTVDDQPEWSPDGGSIAFTRCQSSALCHVFTVKPDGSDLQPLGALCPEGAHETTCADEEGASFAPSSREVALVQATGHIRSDPSGEQWIEHSTLAILDRDGSNPRVVFRGAAYGGDVAYPVFSPDGKHLVFERIASGFTANGGKHAVFVIDADGTHLRRLTPWAESSGDNPDWSPDGKWIVFHTHVDEEGEATQIFLIHPDGTGRRQVTRFPENVQLGSTSFSPDGKQLVISEGTSDGNLHVYTMRLDGTKLHRVTRSAMWDSAPAWGPGA